MFIFNSQIKYGALLSEYSQEQIKNEPMFFNCDGEYAFHKGESITKQFLSRFLIDENIQNSGIYSLKDIVVDTRVHMLMPGWYPCIPGFHFDDVPRTLDNGQPDHENPIYKSNHCIALINGDICPTQFAIGKANFSPVREDEIYYKKWHPEVVRHIYNGELKTILAPDRTLIFFDWNTWHQGTKCIKSGWRWFGRISWNTDRIKNVTNEIRKQVQVYLEFPMEGW